MKYIIIINKIFIFQLLDFNNKYYDMIGQINLSNYNY